MSIKQTPSGQSTRVAVEEATGNVLGVPLIRFSGFDFEIEDPSERERAIEGDTVHYDRPVDPSGSFSLYPTSPSVSAMYEAILARKIGSVAYTLPDDDTKGRHAVTGVRFTNVSQDELDTGYLYTGDWEGDFVI
ncbi:hypothetical protein [Halalkalicoccus jeotgali]|uniref:Uncharacterized protein n=1 Tax=Halalkalicoccus jeotgali (strain DSM 18796 / CECT 7217 / JCM 14584 / KCTC 4019 / B3) TaxID=795797 RepID=D8J9V1_HALJB|nr:hypothetical protein [Halalkalicoccus jeotgali]ADJ14473.1 hypothetical protein HacjB3_05410 [Halalkalicoccus jeotgali B3]ELY40187.1 hypothetical protein C497_03785 [Halalkalicoccus jeotgali B3]